MTFWPKSSGPVLSRRLLRAFLLPGVVLSLLISLNGCGRSSSPEIAPAERPQLPELPGRLRDPCPDPGVNPDALRALIENREALATCRRLHGEIVFFYDDLRQGLTSPQNAP